MHIEYDRDTCTGMFQCIHEWDRFTQNLDAGKAELEGSEEREGNLHVREVPEGEEFEAEMAARVCPVDAIALFDDEGERIV
ncbi:MAG: ferredoxin [Halobacteriales archaeon]|nr:ferredoxin [Halobacteriales archaeon]